MSEQEIEDGYEGALKAAGATVHCLEYFGSCQGDIWAKVTYGGQTGWITFDYGSCTGCDSYEHTFRSWDGGKTKTRVNLAEFGKSYLDDILTQEAALTKAGENTSWDDQADKMVQFIRKHADV